MRIRIKEHNLKFATFIERFTQLMHISQPIINALPVGSFMPCAGARKTISEVLLMIHIDSQSVRGESVRSGAHQEGSIFYSCTFFMDT
jgi:hypothetical protein